jgi:putative flippase GtrA
MLVLGVAAGSIVALAFNFLVSKHFVFQAKAG